MFTGFSPWRKSRKLHPFRNTYLTTTSYIISVNANISSQSGGTCVCTPTKDDPVCDLNEEYMLCVGVVQRDLVTATAAIAALTSVRSLVSRITQDVVDVC